MNDPDPQASVDPFVATQLMRRQAPRKDRCPYCIDGTVFLSPDYEKTCVNCEGRGFIVVNKGKL